MGSKKDKRARDRMFSENPYCRICGVKMVHPDEIGYEGSNRLLEYPDNLLTYEHWNTKLESGRSKGDFKNIVVCLKCNQGRNDDSMRGVPIEARTLLSELGHIKRKLEKYGYKVKYWKP